MTFSLSNFEPDYTLLAFFFIKAFLYTEVIGALGFIRMIVATRSAKWAAFGTFLLGLLALAAKYIPAVTGLTGTNIGNNAAQLIAAGDGMALPLAASLTFLLSAVLPGRRWWVLDVVHLIAFLGFCGLWIYAQI